MREQPLGRTSMTISAIGLGGAPFGREIDEEQSRHILDYCVDKGITWIDTAEGYGGGDARAYRTKVFGIDDVREKTQEMASSECIIGRWLKDRNCRPNVKICTKVSTGNSSQNIDRALAGSLGRLQTDYLDAFLLHGPDEHTPIEESLASLTEHVKAGRVKAIGCSNFNLEHTREALDISAAHGYSRIEVSEPIYNLACTQEAKDLFPYLASQQIAITAYSPLGAGFLTGKYTPDRSRFPEGTRFHIIPGHADVYFCDRNFRVVEALRQKADQLGLPMVRLAMAWAMQHPDITTTLVGGRRLDHIDNALAAYEMVLDPQLYAEMAAWN